MRVAQFVLVLVLLFVSTYVLIYAFQKPSWWWTGWILLAIGTILSMVTFRERT